MHFTAGTTTSRVTAAVFGLAALLPGSDALAAAAARISVLIEFVLQWSDELVSRESDSALFDALGSKEKPLERRTRLENSCGISH